MMTLDMQALARRGAATRLQEIATEISDLQTWMALHHNGHDTLAALTAFNASVQRAFPPTPPRQAGELEMEVAAHVRPRRRQRRRTPQTPAVKAAKRAETAAFLATFTKPISLSDLRRAGIILPARATIGALVRYGYLRQKGDVYYPTRKQFHE